ncbi:MAG TPA: ankyrin repeat domain-containing protein [Thermoanaerobaculia bacterium]|nr:ankyrin repeat domain-containing protein [Thermoanaerobaculia bacterium]
MSRLADEQLLKAASEGDLSGVEQALRSGADVDAKGTFNDTALNGACTWGHTEVVKLLLEAGADVENKGGADMTPLMNAASRGHFEVVQLLLQKGARVSDDLLSIIQTKVNILEENAEAGMVLWEGVAAWKSRQQFLLTERLRQDVPAMASALREADQDQQREATRALAEASRRGIDVSAAAEGLRGQLSSTEGDTREQASEALARCLAFGGDGTGLLELLQAEDERHQSGAISGLVYAARDGAGVGALVGPIGALLAHRLPDIRFTAALALAFAARNGVDISPTMPALTQLLADGEAKVRRGTATAFSLIARSGVDVASALPALRALVSDPDAGVSAQAAKAVAASGEA